MKEQTVARFTGSAFVLMGAVALVFAIIGIYAMLQFGPMLQLATAVPGAPPIGLYILLFWVLLIVELLIGIFSLIAGIGWLKYKFEAAA